VRFFFEKKIKNCVITQLPFLHEKDILLSTYIEAQTLLIKQQALKRRYINKLAVSKNEILILTKKFTK
jgi:hypothetical protein